MSALRGVGYSLDAAVADLIDNSISAGASKITITPRWTSSGPELAILDDGRGMALEALVEAMRFGGKGAGSPRAASDLGRFGLGLKTASLSQARSITVATRIPGGEAHAMCWDVEHVLAAGGRWEVLTVERDDPSISDLSASMPSGTLVLWRKVDFGRVNDAASEASFRSELRSLEGHLAMVFHRFLESGTLSIRLGNVDIAPWDPFLQNHQPASDEIGRDVIRTPSGDVIVTGFVLPHRDRFRNNADFDRAGGPDGWHAHQGFHIYRGGRLVVAGGWMRLGQGRAWRRAETSRLARIRIELPTTSDFDWQIDVKKSVARPPAVMRPRLERLAEDVRRHALDVHLHRGARRGAGSAAVAPMWLRDNAKGGRFSINRSHPAVQSIARMCGGAGVFDGLLRSIEASVPVEAIWLDAAEGTGPPASDDAAMSECAVQFCRLLMEQGSATGEAIEKVASSDPFTAITGLADQLRARLE